MRVNYLYMRSSDICTCARLKFSIMTVEAYFAGCRCPQSFLRIWFANRLPRKMHHKMVFVSTWVAWLIAWLIVLVAPFILSLILCGTIYFVLGSIYWLPSTIVMLHCTYSSSLSPCLIALVKEGSKLGMLCNVLKPKMKQRQLNNVCV